MKADSIAVPKVSVAGAIVPIAATLMNMSVNIAVQDGHSHIGAIVDCIPRSHGTSIVDEAMESKPILFYKSIFLIKVYQD